MYVLRGKCVCGKFRYVHIYGACSNICNEINCIAPFSDEIARVCDCCPDKNAHKLSNSASCVRVARARQFTMCYISNQSVSRLRDARVCTARTHTHKALATHNIGE